MHNFLSIRLVVRLKCSKQNLKHIRVKNTFVLLILSGLIETSLLAQTYSLKGVVADENNRPLMGATVLLHPGHIGSTTDVEGKYLIGHVPRGRYRVDVSFVGFRTFVDTVTIAENTTVNVRLMPLLMSLTEVVISDNYAATLQREMSMNVEVVSDEFLKQNQGGSLMHSLERLPGVSNISIGAGQSKPVIRGLGFDRLVVMENGIAHEGQQWGSDHGLEIDQFAVDRVEVIKGPASLLYGAGAMGGVVNLNMMETPSTNSYMGSLQLNGASNNRLAGTSLYTGVRRGGLFFTVRGTLASYGDYRVPTNEIKIYEGIAMLHENKMRNTAGREQNVHLSAGWINNGFSTRVYFSNVSTKAGMFANAHGLEPRNVITDIYDQSERDIMNPFQQVNHTKIVSKARWEKGKFHVENELGFQHNLRHEYSDYVPHGYMPATYPDTLPYSNNLERKFDKYIYSGNLRTGYSIDENSSVVAGISGTHQRNTIGGHGFIIPAFRQITIGTFGYIKHQLSSKSLINAGIRYDYGNLNTDSYTDWFESRVVNGTDTNYVRLQRAASLHFDFGNVSWSAGYNYNAPRVAFRLNIGKSFRMPIAKELAANGVNYHHFSYEVGNPDLKPEVSYQADAGAEYMGQRLAVGISPFVNYFTNYIYLNPSSEHDTQHGAGHQRFYYSQSEVLRSGAEIHAHYSLSKTLKLGVIGEYIYQVQLSGEKRGYALPFSPPASALINVKWEPHTHGALDNTFVTFDLRLTAPQKNIVPPEKETQGYGIITIGAGGNLRLMGHETTISVQVKNLLNTYYFNHTSYYRIVNVPEQGRNVMLHLTIPFSGKI